MVKKIIFCTLFLLLSFGVVFSDTLILKNGERIEGKIIEQEDRQVRIESNSLELIYFTDEIERVIFDAGAVSAPSADKPEALVARFMDLYSLNAIFRQMLQDTPMLIRSSLADIEPNRLEKIEKALNQDFQGLIAPRIIMEEFLKDFRQEYMASLLQWVESPQAKKLFLSFEEGIKPQNLQNSDNYLSRNPASEQRVGLIEKFDQAIGLSDLLVKKQMSILGVAKIIKYNLSNKQVTEDRFNEEMSALQQQLQVSERRRMLDMLLFFCRDFTDAELKEYIEFYNSDAGRWMAILYSDNLAKGLNDYSRKVLDESGLSEVGK